MANSRSNAVTTGIASLDTLLGNGGEIPPGNTVLIRGGPGAGKTTLALQILANHLDPDKHPGADATRYAVFVSLEGSPDVEIKHAEKAFQMKFPRVLCLDRNDLLATKLSHPTTLKQGEEAVREDCHRILQQVLGLSGAGGHDIGSAVTRLPTLLVIDSLNLLPTLAPASNAADGSSSLRQSLQGICAEMRQRFAWTVVVFTAEYDVNNPRSASVASESYFSDVEIQLLDERVVREIEGLPMRMPEPGSEQTPFSQFTQRTTEIGRFCRVIKNRRGNSQSRRCAYDIINRLGIQFFDTYPGDGQVLLFAENSPQREEWNDFFKRDIQHLYPALYFDVFDRGGLQRTFASLRRIRNIPERTDSYLSSFDEYWIRWYVELRQRWMLAHLFNRRELVGDAWNDTALRTKLCEQLGQVHRDFLKGLIDPDASPDCDAIAGRICAALGDGVVLFMSSAEWSATWSSQLQGMWEEFKSEDGQSGLLKPIPQGSLWLFGERDSEIIPELDHPRKPGLGGPVFRPMQEEATGASRKLLAIPYNANIGFLVCRRDLLDNILDEIESSPARRKELEASIAAIHEDRVAAVQAFQQRMPADAPSPLPASPPATPLPQAVNTLVDQLLTRSAGRRTGIPQAWEEVIALCTFRAKRLQFLIETRTFDSLLCTLLEFLWGTGGDFHVSADYQVKYPQQTKVRLFDTFYLLRRMLWVDEIIPCNCTLEPADFARRFGKGSTGPDWLFARHWYSTFVDVFTAKTKGGYLWEPKPGTTPKLDVGRIPVSLAEYLRTCGAAVHRSCTGVWYLAVLRGSENQGLAADVINNLMSSSKICDRASACAAVPTTKEFYQMYGGAKCFNIPDRQDVALPDASFDWIKDELLANAFSRRLIFDYRHCMRELHGVLQWVLGNPAITDEQLGDRVSQAVDRIQGLGAKPMLISQPEPR